VNIHITNTYNMGLYCLTITHKVNSSETLTQTGVTGKEFVSLLI